MSVLDGRERLQVTSEPAQQPEDPPLKDGDTSDDQARGDETVGVVRAGNSTDVHAQQARHKRHGQEEAGGDSEQVHGARHPVTAPTLM